LSREEQDWVKRVLEGDQDAYRNLIRAYQDMAYTIAFALIKDAHLTEEVVQDAFLKAYQRLHQFKFDSSFKTWFYRIVTNEALMYLRKQKKHTILLIDLPEVGEDTENEITYEDLEKYIEPAMMNLPPRESLVLRLFYLEQMSIQTVADATGWSVNNIKIILHRARKRMKLIINVLIKNEKYAS